MKKLNRNPEKISNHKRF